MTNVTLRAFVRSAYTSPVARRRDRVMCAQRGRARVTLRQLVAACLGRAPAKSATLDLDSQVYPLMLPGKTQHLVVVAAGESQLLGYVFFQYAKDPAALNMLECAMYENKPQVSVKPVPHGLSRGPSALQCFFLWYLMWLLHFVTEHSSRDNWALCHGVNQVLYESALGLLESPLSLTGQEELRQLLEYSSMAASDVTFKGVRHASALVNGKQKNFLVLPCHLKRYGSGSVARVDFKVCEPIDGVILKVYFDKDTYEYLVAWHPDDPNHPTYGQGRKRGWFDESERNTKGYKKTLRAYYELTQSGYRLLNRDESVIQFHRLSSIRENE